MHNLIRAATQFELDSVPETRDASDRLLTGVGIPAVFAHLRWVADERTAQIVNVGIAGAYPETGLAIGDIVLADGEVYGDIGFEIPGDEGFRSIGDSPFGDFYQTPFPTIRPVEWSVPAPADVSYPVHVGRGCTVNTCTGTAANGVRRRDRFGASFETMEGAAVAQIGQLAGVPVCEIRAISNIAGERDMRPENIRLALTNLRAYLETCLAARR